MSTKLSFEHPLNERIRTFLRLEHLFERVAHFLPQQDPWAARAAVEGLLDIVSITSRSDIKTELLRELDRNSTTLNRISRQPVIDQDSLRKVLEDLRQAANGLHGLTGAIGQRIREDDFLKSVAQRNSIPGGTCSFDLPYYHHWLIQPAEIRGRRLIEWSQELEPVSHGIELVLSLARASASPRQVVAAEGFFQEALDLQAPAQLLRVTLDGTPPLFPEISGHTNRFSIRFMGLDQGNRPEPYRGDVDFILTCCVF